MAAPGQQRRVQVRARAVRSGVAGVRRALRLEGPARGARRCRRLSARRSPTSSTGSIENRPTTIAHTDFRLDNFFFDHADGSPVTIIDWQLSVRNVGAIDVGYFLGESLSIEDRRAHERDLLERYHDGLVAGGVTGYSFDDLYDDYRMSLVTQLTIPVIGSSMDLGQRARGAALRRCGGARPHRHRRSRRGPVLARVAGPKVRP